MCKCLPTIGICRAIGVSNYTEKHLDELISSCEIKPMVNQVEVHPWLAQPRLRNACNSHGVVVQAYSPLGVGSVCPFPIETLTTKFQPFVQPCFEIFVSFILTERLGYHYGFAATHGLHSADCRIKLWTIASTGASQMGYSE